MINVYIYSMYINKKQCVHDSFPNISIWNPHKSLHFCENFWGADLAESVGVKIRRRGWEPSWRAAVCENHSICETCRVAIVVHILSFCWTFLYWFHFDTCFRPFWGSFFVQGRSIFNYWRCDDPRGEMTCFLRSFFFFGFNLPGQNV